MYKFLAISSFCLLMFSSLFSQKETIDFSIPLPKQKLHNSLYNSIAFLDSRLDTSNMGIIEIGPFAKKARVIPKPSMKEQLNNLAKAETDISARNGELLLQLRHFAFANINEDESQQPYCYLRANLYAKKGDRYQPVANIDTMIFNTSWDAEKGIYSVAAEAISSIIINNLSQPSLYDFTYSYQNVVQMDNLEKREMPLYTATAYTDGVYVSYNAFAHQTPDADVQVEMADSVVTVVKAPNARGKFKKVIPEQLYAFVYKGQPYISTDFGYYPLYKRNDSFFFTGKVKENPKKGKLGFSVFLYGVGGDISTLFENNHKDLYTVMIDHLHGDFIRIGQVPGK